MTGPCDAAARARRHARCNLMRSVAAVCVLSAGACTGGPSPDGRAPPTLTPVQNGAPQSGTSDASPVAGAGNTGAGSESSQSASSPDTRHRPGGLIGSVFSLSPVVTECGPAAIFLSAGTSDAALRVEQLADADSVCFTGFPADAAPRLLVTKPDGVQVDLTTRLWGSSAGWAWFFRASLFFGSFTGIGDYQFVATSEPPATAGSSSTGSSTDTGVGSAPAATIAPLTASGQISVIAATESRAEVTRSSNEVRVGFAGFPSSRPVLISIYGPAVAMKDNQFRYRFPLLADLPDSRADSNGDGVVSWSPSAGLPRGDYVVWFDPPLACGQMCLRFKA
jgi:hypothetical protein